jgi:hypothetical protein
MQTNPDNTKAEYKGFLVSKLMKEDIYNEVKKYHMIIHIKWDFAK